MRSFGAAAMTARFDLTPAQLDAFEFAGELSLGGELRPVVGRVCMDQVVVDMHTSSGLLDQIRASTISLAEL